MILQALKYYYDRKAKDPNADIAKYGFEWKEIPYIVVLNSDGRPVSLYSTYEGEGRKRRAKSFMVPHTVKRAVNITSNLLWDNPEYALGIPQKGKKRSGNKSEDEVLQRVKDQHADFKKRIDELDIDDAGINAVRIFLNANDKTAMLSSFSDVFDQMIEEGKNISFQLAGEKQLIAESSQVREVLVDMNSDDSGPSSVCLISGRNEPVKRLHDAIKGVWGAQSSGANIVSFNLNAFTSFEKKQGENAPVSEKAAFAYTTALNHLLQKDSKQRMQIGDASTVFWADKSCEFENQILDFFSEPPKDDPDRNVRAVMSLFRAPQSGAMSENVSENRFYVLGLSPNASRISVRFWIVDTVAGMAEKIRIHFEDTRICHGPKDKDYLSLFRILVNTAVQGKSENIPPNLSGDTMRAVLQGLPYPNSLLQAAVRRIRAEREISYPRVALIKACINRSIRFFKPNRKEDMKVSLDKTNTNIGYRLGRLFAVLEKIQAESHPGINATIRDKFYGAASGTPVTVFGNLMRLKNHHLAKLEHAGRKVFFEKLLCEIMDEVHDFPPHLALEDQGRFAIGYYHQTQDLFTKKNV